MWDFFSSWDHAPRYFLTRSSKPWVDASELFVSCTRTEIEVFPLTDSDFVSTYVALLLLILIDSIVSKEIYFLNLLVLYDPVLPLLQWMITALSICLVH